MYNLTKRQGELNNIRDNVASVRHLLDSVRLDAQDACKEKPWSPPVGLA